MRSLSFPLFFDVFLGPLVSAVTAPVRVLKLFNVNDYWWSFSNNEVRHRGCIKKPRPASGWINIRRWYWFSVHVNKLLAHKLDVESASTSWAVSEKLHPGDTLSELS